MSAQEWQPRQHDPLCPAFESCGYCDAPADYTEPRKLGTSMGPMIVEMRPVCELGSCVCTCSEILEIRTDERQRVIRAIQQREATLHNLDSSAYAEIVHERQVFGTDGPTLREWVAFQKGLLYGNVVITEPPEKHPE